MYESSIKRVFCDIKSPLENQLKSMSDDIQDQIAKKEEEILTYEITQAVGYSVDKEELIAALEYDRDQYRKGYNDAMDVIENIKADIDKYLYDEGFGLSYRKDILDIIDKRVNGKGENDADCD